MIEMNNLPEERSTPLTHDAYIRWAFSNSRRVALLLQGISPPRLLAGINLAATRPARDTWITRALRERRADLVFELYGIGKNLLAAFLIEHKSASDSKAYFQTLEYTGILYQNMGSEIVRILPIIIYTGKKSWEVPRQLDDLVTVDSWNQLGIADYGTNLRCLIVNLNAPEGSDQWLDRTKFPREIQLILNAASEVWYVGDDPKRMARMMVELSHPEFRQTEEGRELTEVTGRFILSHTDYSGEDIKRIVKEYLPEEVSEMKSTWEQLMEGEQVSRAEGERIGIAKGERIGIAKGERIGVAKGRAEGEQTGIAKGERIGRVEDAIRMIRRNLNDDLIREITQLPVAEIERLRKTHND